MSTSEPKEITERVSVVENIVSVLVERVGQSPDPIRGTKGTGLSGLVAELTVSMRDLQQAIDEDRKAREEERAQRLKKLEPWSKAGWIAIGAIIAVGVGGFCGVVWHWVITLHH